MCELHFVEDDFVEEARGVDINAEEFFDESSHSTDSETDSFKLPLIETPNYAVEQDFVSASLWLTRVKFQATLLEEFVRKFYYRKFC
ncbi:hypothetical protein HNY73_015192 [Argiope bruennichi]|uniref:Uncharacterized protein n=1 Tax=Argiope bruennichi TaxID=94029 RepID=A0A8T0ERC4_ARGBR|nr:hypothetical protein HNY73_015192 [Argiope bruennichi]